MMGNDSSQSSSPYTSKNSVPLFLQSQTSPILEGEEEDWNFREFLGIVQRRMLVIVIVAAAVTPAFISLTSKGKAEYESSFRLLVEPVNDDTKVLDMFKDPNLGKSSLDYDSQIQVLKSPEEMSMILEQLRISYPEIDYSSLVGALTITRLGETKILEVRYRGNDPQKVKVVLDTVAQDYLNYSREKRQSKLRQGLQFVEKQLPFIQKRVDNVQKDLQIFRQKYDFINPDSQEQQISNQVSLLAGQRQAVDQQLAQLRASFANLQKEDGKLAVLNNAPVYQQLIAQVRQLDTQIALESTRFQDDNPTIEALKKKKESLLPLLNQEAQRFLDVKTAEVATQLQTLQVQSQELTKAEQKLEQKRKLLPVLARQYTELQRKLQVTTDSLNRFLATRENLQIQGAQTELGWQLIQPATKPNGPVSAVDIKRNILMGLLAGLASGIGIALLIEKFDKTYHSIDSLKKDIQLPLIGHIPFEKQLHSSKHDIHKQKTPIVKVPHSLSGEIPGMAMITIQDYSKYSAKFLEALRVLYTNIQFLSSDHRIRSIIISSAMAGDGKSTVAFHLAQIATTMGQRVLLVDANLRQPIIHFLSNLNNTWGLSNILSMNMAVDTAIQQLPSLNQLSVITAGPIPPDSTKLLSSQKMKGLMEEFHHHFDLVIYDAPPLVGLADATLLTPQTDGLILIGRIGKTNSSKLKQALDILKNSRVNVLGIVSNGQKNNLDISY